MNIFASLDPSVKKLLGWKMGDEEEKWALKAVESLVKKLRKRRSINFQQHNGGGALNGGCGTVEDLEYALAHPGSHSKCVTIPRSLDGRLQVSHRKGLPHVIYCRVWRWPNLQSHHELKPTPDCAFPYDSRSEFICINPYHYQRVESSSSANLLRSANISTQQRQPADAAFFNANSSQLINGTLMGFPPCSSATPSYPNFGASQNTIQPQQHNNCFQSQSQPQLQSQQQHYSNLLNNGGTFFFGNNSSQNLSGGGSASTTAALGGCYCSGASSSAASSSVGSRASSVISAQSPSALSDDDDFGAAAAAAAAAAAIAAAQSANGHCYMGYDSRRGQMSENTAAIDSLPDYWCSICYYELNSRVGEPFKISSAKVTVDGFTNPLNDEERICLGLLSNVNRNNTIECTRRHIGKGVRFTCTESSVVVMNLSESPVFVQSRNSNFKYNLQSTAVCRVPSNASIIVFDFPLFHNMLEKARQEGYNHVYDLQKMCFIRMSFVKGWGIDYHRQDVTSTPCWIEIQLHRPLAWIDSVLAPMNPPDHLDITSVS